LHQVRVWLFQRRTRRALEISWNSDRVPIRKAKSVSKEVSNQLELLASGRNGKPLMSACAQQKALSNASLALPKMDQQRR
jgi:hypothetical protein